MISIRISSVCYIDFTIRSRARLPESLSALIFYLAIKDKIYVIGANEWGGDGYAIDVYDSSADKWTTKKPMPFYRYYFGVGVVNNMIYLIGGHSSVPMDPENETELYYYDSEHVLEYNPINESWTKKAKMPIVRANPGIAVIDNKIYAIGGDQGNETQVYDPSTDTWATKTPMIRKNSRFGIGVLEKKIHVIGGDFGAHDSHDVYDPTTDSWEEYPSMPSARWSLGVGVVDNRIFAIGGTLGASTMNTTEEFNLNVQN